MYLPQITEEWKIIPSFPDYEASNLGEIRNQKTQCVRRQYTTKAFYKTVTIRKKTLSVHRLVKSAFEGRILQKTELVRHVDGNSLNNSIRNLILGSAKQNARDKIEHNTNGRILRNNDVHRLRESSRRNRSLRLISNRFNISRSHACNILAGRRWGNLP